MAIMDPLLVPPHRRHLDDDERQRLLRLELLADQGRFDDAQEVAEDLWLTSTDAHKRLFQGISNALTAVCARQAGHLRGARQIAERSRLMLADYPRRVIGLELDALLDSMDDFVKRGEGPILLRRQGGGS
jgi:hypothetical protein